MNATTPTPFNAEGPQPLLRDTPSGAPYPVHALGPLQPAVEAVQGQTQAPIAIPAQSALSVASLAVQGFADVETLGGNRAASLFALTIAQSGERKSSCDAPLLQGLREFEREQTVSQRDEVESWKTTHAIWDAKRKAALNEVKSKKTDISQGAEADLNALGDEPLPPMTRDRTVSEPTYEGLVRKLDEGQPSLGLFSDEGGQFLGGYAMSKDNRQKTLAAFNDLWQGNPIQRTRLGDGSFVLYGRRLAVHLMVQPSVARAFMADPMTDDTGFLPRFLICEPQSTIGTRLHKNARPNPEALSAFAKRLREILETPLPMDEKSHALSPRAIPLSHQAREALIEFADNTERQMLSDGAYANVKGYAAKAAEQATRIAGVMTLWDDLHAHEVSQSTMANAIVLTQFYLSEALRLSDAAVISQEIEQADTLRRWLIEKWGDTVILPSDVLQRAPIRALRERPKANKAIATLVEAGWLIPLDEGTEVRGKSRKAAYRIVKG